MRSHRGGEVSGTGIVADEKVDALEHSCQVRDGPGREGVGTWSLQPQDVQPPLRLDRTEENDHSDTRPKQFVNQHREFLHWPAFPNSSAARVNGDEASTFTEVGNHGPIPSRSLLQVYSLFRGNGDPRVPIIHWYPQFPQGLAQMAGDVL